MTETNSSVSDVQPPAKPSIWRVVKDQRKIELVALGLTVASFWLAGAAGEWRLAFCIAVGVLLGLVNHLSTEYWLLKTISSGEQPTRGQMVRSTISRLAVIAIVAIGAAVLLWPDGIGLLLGLAIFRLIALVMTTIPLLKELKKP